ncbi:MAG: transcriptional repressor LexA [Bdellovibrionales bacterium]
MLTNQQQQLLEFLQKRLEETGVCPSFDEMREALDLKSKSGIHRLITALEERGFIRRLENRARAIEIRKLPVAAVQPKVAIKHVPEGMVSLPLCGRIAAGLPIEALQNPRDEVEVPANMLGRGGDHYALEVAGDSMIEAGIMDGDTVLIRRTQQADNGQIVVALIDDETATLKRLQKRGKQIVLESANSNYAPQVYDARRVQIQGKLVSLLRQY